MTQISEKSISAIESDPRNVERAYQLLPVSVAELLKSDSFEAECRSSFDEIAAGKEEIRYLDAFAQLAKHVLAFDAGRPLMPLEATKAYELGQTFDVAGADFDAGRPLSAGEFVSFVRFSIAVL